MTRGFGIAMPRDRGATWRRLTGRAGPRIEALSAAAGTWLGGRTPRERALLAILAAIAVLSLTARLVWMPLLAAQQTARDSLARYDRLAARFAAEGPAVARIAAARQGTLAAILAARAARAHLPVARIDPQGSAVAVGFESVEFDALVDWLAALDADAAVSVVELKLDRREAGLVAAQVTLRER